MVFLLVGGVIAWLLKITAHHEVKHYPRAAVSSEAPPKAVFAEQEQQRELQLETQRAERDSVRHNAEKEKTVECQFWRQQKREGKHAMVDRKIQHYCLTSQSPSHKAANIRAIEKSQKR
ncbi:MAG TPA: hypothetical protein VN030_11115 [Cellvibrio sp.]|nr:hypothetical protein [Cellvibrio sp.]